MHPAKRRGVDDPGTKIHHTHKYKWYKTELKQVICLVRANRSDKHIIRVATLVEVSAEARWRNKMTALTRAEWSRSLVKTEKEKSLGENCWLQVAVDNNSNTSHKKIHFSIVFHYNFQVYFSYLYDFLYETVKREKGEDKMEEKYSKTSRGSDSFERRAWRSKD